MAKPGDKVWTGDVAVPMSRLPQLIEDTKADIKNSGMYGTIVGHVGDGNFHSEFTKARHLVATAVTNYNHQSFCYPTTSRGMTQRSWCTAW